MTSGGRDGWKAQPGPTRDLLEQVGQLEIELEQSDESASRHLSLATRASVIGAIAVLGAVLAALLG
jgi:hypothetical protein